MLKNYKILVSWLLSLLFGGLFLTILVYVIDKTMSSWAYYTLKRVLESLLYSTIFNVLASIVPLIIILIRNPILKRRSGLLKPYFRKLKSSIFLGYGISFAAFVMYYIFFELASRMRFRENFELSIFDFIPVFVCILFFFLNALSVYFASLLVFRKERRKLKEHPELSGENLIDSESF